MNTNFIDELARRLSATLPPGVKVLGEDLQNNMRSVLHSAFSKMDLVTREEFEVQSQVLARTRAKLEELEKKIAELEQSRQG